MRPRTIAASAAGLALALWIAIRTFVPPTVDTVSASRTDLVQAVVATGRVRSLSRAQLGSMIPAVATRVLVREGDRVATGQLLIQLDDSEARAQLEQARGTLARAEATTVALRAVRAGAADAAARSAEAAYQTALREFDRAQRLYEAGAGAAQELDLARQGLEAARANRDIALLEFAAVTGDGAEVRAAMAQVEEARAAVALARARLEHTRITAPGPGRVLGRSVEPGDVVSVGRTLLTLALDGPTQLVALPDERDVARVTVGQPAMASADAYPDQTFPATVTFVAPVIDAAQGTVEVRLEVPDPPAFLRPDMTVSIRIEVARRSGVVALPSVAVQDASAGEPWVLALRHGRLQRQLVRLGLRGDEWVEIQTGVAEGERIAVPPWDGLKPGRRARAR